MNVRFLFISLLLLIAYQVYGQKDSIFSADIGKIYKNDTFRYSVNYPDNWKFYEYNNTLSDVSITEWILPKIYKVQIDDKIVIRSYKNIDLTNGVSSFCYQTDKGKGFPGELTVYGISDGIEKISTYRDEIEKKYCIIKNDIGYVISLIATDDTYEKNLELFELFYQNIQFNQKE